MNEFTLIQLEWNCYNGFVFNFIDVEIGDFEGSLLGLNFGKGLFCFSILFFYFEVKSPINF